MYKDRWLKRSDSAYPKSYNRETVMVSNIPYDANLSLIHLENGPTVNLLLFYFVLTFPAFCSLFLVLNKKGSGQNQNPFNKNYKIATYFLFLIST